MKTASLVTVELREQVLREFSSRFGGKPTFLARAPGRVNLIGDHTDYNDGFVLPMAIDREVWLAVTVAVLGGLGPFAGSIGFVVADRRRAQNGAVSTRYS